jgi:GntR family transcriptional repressor for pyruvate dehydrogenase complex
VGDLPEAGAGEDGAGSRPTAAGPKPGVAVRRVRKAYEQVADQLRELVMTGELTPGQRLPTESVLASDFGVSRATIREALRVLAAQSLIRTSKGASGGSFVTLPTVDYISSFVHANVNLLTETKLVTLEELLEARELVEVPAARLAAVRRTDEDIERLRSTVPDDAQRLDTSEEFTHNAEFHTCMLDASRNTLLTVSAQPIFSVLQTNLARSTLGREFHRAIHAHHLKILEAVEAGDPDGAEREMRDHLAFLRPWYEKAWKRAASGRARR